MEKKLEIKHLAGINLEDFKEIPNKKSRYFINRDGVIVIVPYATNNNKYTYTTKYKICVSALNQFGYPCVPMLGASYLVHRLLAKAFIPNPNNHPVINHIDGVKTNNNLSNLEWCTHKHNQQHAYDIGLKIGYFTGKKGYDHHSSKEVTQLTMEGKEVARFGSAALAAVELRTHQSNISRCCRGERFQHKGYKFIYSDSLTDNPYEK